jgi:hypothetical protein
MRKSLSTLLVCTLALAMGCARQSAPTSPSSTNPAKTAAAADGSTLKATAPVPQSPVNSLRLTFGTPLTLVVGNATTTFTTGVALTYKFEVYNAAGTRVYTSPNVTAGSGTTSHAVTATLDGDQTFSWQARAEFEGSVGPWSSRAAFVTAVTEPDGYISGNELYDPLTKGKTVGQTHGAVTFIPGVGIRLDDLTSYVSYDMGAPLTAGEFSVLMTNIVPGAAGLKTKVFSMSQGYDDMTTNARRFTIEKRGTTEPGAIAWRIIANDGAIETVGDERRVVSFQPSMTYFWRATWTSAFRLTINEGGVTGRNVYDFTRGLLGVYDANPLKVFLGSPESRSGPDSQTAPGIVIRQVWVSRNPRPEFANR